MMDSLTAAQFPSRADCNPYIHLLKTAIGEWQVASHEHSLFLEGLGHPYPILDRQWLQRHRRRVQVLHFHWLQKFYKAPTRRECEKKIALFSDFLSQARELDYRLAYTFHNIIPHEGMGEELDFRVRRIMLDQADIITCFSRRQQAHLEKTFGPLSLTVIPHPSYVGYYPEQLSEEECRQRLGLPREGRVLSFIGLVRPYKELAHLITEFSAAKLPDTHLVLAGTALDASQARQLETLAEGKPNLHCHLHWIEDREIQVYLKASDVVVLPYRKCWTSGAIMLAFSFGRPVISSDPLMLDDLSDLGFFYHSDAGLRSALMEAAIAEPVKLADMGRHCLDFARRLPWREAGRAFALAYRKACGAARPPLSSAGTTRS
jgi:beta-1,4-mannosyltransferase